MSKEAYKSGRIRHVQQDSNREFISLLACICADGSALPPALIYQGSSGDLQNTWIDDLHEEDEAFFASSENSWSSDAFRLAWLRLFDRNTCQKGSRKRLLIVDGHSSHVNMGLVTLADDLRILLFILPPHTTHRLQPLDVGLFSPLSQAYSKRLDAYTHGGLGWVTMTKRMFWPLFRDAWKDSFTLANIKNAFKKTGIWPLSQEKNVESLQKAPLRPATPARLPPLPINTPLTCHGLRQLIKKPPSSPKFDILQRAVIRLATLYEIQNHENRNLRNAITAEKQKRSRGKRLNLLGEEVTPEAQFFSPSRVLAAKLFQETKEAAEQEARR